MNSGLSTEHQGTNDASRTEGSNTIMNERSEMEKKYFVPNLFLKIGQQNIVYLEDREKASNKLMELMSKAKTDGEMTSIRQRGLAWLHTAMPIELAWARGQHIAEETIKQHLSANNGRYPETIACPLWEVDTKMTGGEPIAIVLALVGARPVEDDTGNVRYDLIPVDELKRPRIDILVSLDAAAAGWDETDVIGLLDDMFERCANADEPEEMNFIKKHALELKRAGIERPAARLFSNPPRVFDNTGCETINSRNWRYSESFGEAWKKRNDFAYGRYRCTACPEVLDKLLRTTERIVQEIFCIESGLTDNREYYADTIALKKAAENRKPVDEITKTKKGKTNKKKKSKKKKGESEKKRKIVAWSIAEAFGDEGDMTPRVADVEAVLLSEYCLKLLESKWIYDMLEQGSCGAVELSRRMTALVGWAATVKVDNFVFNQAAELYVFDRVVAKKIQELNPEAFNNVVRSLLDASGRGLWKTDNETLLSLVTSQVGHT